MNDNSKDNLTLEERLSMASRSQASSPEAAAALVRRFSKLSAAYLFCGSPDLEAMNELTGEFWEDSRVDVDSCRGFAPSFLMAIEQDCGSSDPQRDTASGSPLWGARVNNALVLLGEMLSDQAMGRRKNKEVYHCTRLTLEQYLDVLSGPDFCRNREDDGKFRAWRDAFLQRSDGSEPMSQALVGILRRYMAGWETFGRLEHILKCLGGLALHIEQEGTKYDLDPTPGPDYRLTVKVSRTERANTAMGLRTALRRLGVGRDRSELPRAEPDIPEPCEYFLSLARTYAPDLPDPGGQMEVRTLREQIYLPYWRYGTDALRKIVEGSPYPEFSELLRSAAEEGRLLRAMEEINTAVTDIYMLWVEPYLHMRK